MIFICGKNFGRVQFYLLGSPLFLWRAIHNALPTTHRLHKIFPHISPICIRCALQEEDVQHLIFGCPSSRTVWFASNMGLRIDQLPNDFSVIVKNILNDFQEDHRKMCFSIMWQIWKGRCDFYFKAHQFDVQSVIEKAQLTVYPKLQNVLIKQRKQHFDDKYELEKDMALLITDGSWDQKGNMGIAAVVYDPLGCLYNQVSKRGVAADALTAESNALLLAIQQAKSLLRVFTKICIFSDSQILVHCVNTRSVQDVPSWQAIQVVQQCIDELSDVQTITVKHAKREALLMAHTLANDARKGDGDRLCISQNQQDLRASGFFVWSLD
ncbi:Ribonuclease H-like superfamily protein [Rhynchospora pubera]|uniref:Ribonuclease H-like superfamily protein n=1 Tax=Rhynchospora pubera TaxID=906938 RepID=A0AAV8FIH7_9POAL|nr:Ribonuclease H-like superfamily protein [Rhynchospora pubera]